MLQAQTWAYFCGSYVIDQQKIDGDSKVKGNVHMFFFF